MIRGVFRNIGSDIAISIEVYTNDKLENLKIFDLNNGTINDIVLNSIDPTIMHMFNGDMYRYDISATANFFKHNDKISIVSDLQSLKEYSDNNTNILKAKEILFDLHPELSI